MPKPPSLDTISNLIRDQYEDAIWEMVKPIRWWSREDEYKEALREWEYEGEQRKLDRIHGPRLGPGPWEHYTIKHHQRWVHEMRTLVPGKKPGRVYRA